MFIASAEQTMFRRARYLIEKTESHVVIGLLLLLNLLDNLLGRGGSGGNGGSDSESGGISEVSLDLFFFVQSEE